MKNSKKAKLVVDIVKRYATTGTSDYINAEADFAKAQMGHDLWEKDNENDFGYNPYNVESAGGTLRLKEEEKIARDEVLAYAIDVFLEKIS